jgi:hypothetical protein
MLEERVAHVNVVLVLFSQLITMNNKKTFVFASPKQVFLWHDFKDIITQLKTNWLEAINNVLTCLVDVTESQVIWALDLWEVFFPLLRKSFKNVGWN